jgi:ribosome-binding factor A
VYISVYDKDEKKAKVIEVLNNAAGFLRKSVGKKLKTHYTPELIFELDDSIEYGAHIEQVLRDLNKQAKGTKDHGDE